MGTACSRAVQACRVRRMRRVLLLGLDGAGKSTLAGLLVEAGSGNGTVARPGDATEETEYVHAEFAGTRLLLTDVAGGPAFRQFWRHHLTGAHGIVFVVDASDRMRFEEARDEMKLVLVDPQVEKVPLLILANKSDVPGAATAQEVRTYFVDENDSVEDMERKKQTKGLDERLHRPVRILSSSLLEDKDVNEAMRWLLTTMHSI